MSPPQEPLVQPGDRIVIPEEAYQGGGRGWLRMRVTRVLAQPGVDVRAMAWVRLTGVELLGATEGRERTVGVRVAALTTYYPPMRPDRRG